MPGFLLPK